MDDDKRLYGVSYGNGNDGVSHSYPSYYVRTNNPYRVAVAALVGDFRQELQDEVKAAAIVEGEAAYTITAFILDPPGQTPDYREIARKAGYDVSEVGETVELFAYHTPGDPESYSEPYATAAEAWKACVEDENLEIPSWSDTNGSYRIVEVFPVDEPTGPVEKPIFEGIEAAFSDELLAKIPEKV